MLQVGLGYYYNILLLLQLIINNKLKISHKIAKFKLANIFLQHTIPCIDWKHLIHMI